MRIKCQRNDECFHGNHILANQCLNHHKNSFRLLLVTGEDICSIESVNCGMSVPGFLYTQEIRFFTLSATVILTVTHSNELSTHMDKSGTSSHE